MKKAHNNKDIENLIPESEDNNIIDSNIEEEEEPTLKEWDIADDDEIHEFLSRDLDVVTRTRQRLREKQEAKEQAAAEKKSKAKKPPKEAKPPKEKKTKKKETEAQTAEGAENKKTPAEIFAAVVAFFKNLWTKWLEIYHKYTMQILYGALGVLALILLVAIVVTNMGDKEPVVAPEQESSSEEESSSQEESTTEEDKTPVAESEESDIHKIVVSYFDALYVQATIEEVSKYVDDVTNFNESRLTTYDKYYESVSNIKCYKYDTTRVENSYVVFVTYDLKMYNIDTAIPSGEALVVKQDADGKYLIHNLTEQEILDLKISNEDYVEYISTLEQQVLDDFNAALESDAELKEIYDMMSQLANKATEQSASDGSSNMESETETTTAAQ